MFRSCLCSLVRWLLGTEREGICGFWQLFNSLKPFDWPWTWFSEAMALSQRELLGWQLMIHQNYVPKLSYNRTLRNHIFMLRLPNPTCKAQFMHGEIPIEVSVTFIHHLDTFWVDLMFNIEHLQLLGAISVTQSQSEWHGKSGQLPGIFCDNTVLWVKTTICGNQPLYFHSAILNKVFRPQEGFPISQRGSPTTK